MYRVLLFFLVSTLFLSACYTHKPRFPFDPVQTPAAPDYSDLNNWAAHPDKADPADRVPNASTHDGQATADIDVFFLYPTTLTGNRRGESRWNGDVRNQKLNAKTDSSTILFQASIFNMAGRVYAPRYRQAHLSSFFTRDTASARRALDIAYSDVQTAFQYYLDHWNQGRPFIIAGHSQGGRHAMYLVRDRVESTRLANRLVAAYIAGWPVQEDFFKHIQPCNTPSQTDCYCSWRTWERRFGRRLARDIHVVCTNPLLWTTEPGVYAPKNLNLGAVLTNFNKVYPGIADAEVYKGILLCTKPHFPGSIFFIKKNYHPGDLNLYYFNVRENARLRADSFFKN